jgi:hypothetical protein
MKVSHVPGPSPNHFVCWLPPERTIAQAGWTTEGLSKLTLDALQDLDEFKEEKWWLPGQTERPPGSDDSVNGTRCEGRYEDKSG